MRKAEPTGPQPGGSDSPSERETIIALPRGSSPASAGHRIASTLIAAIDEESGAVYDKDWENHANHWKS